MQIRIDPYKTSNPALQRNRKGFDYKKIALVGKGAYGEVFLFERLGNFSNNVFAQFFLEEEDFDNQYCAIKKYKLPETRNQGVDFATLREINFMMSLKHPNIITAQEVFAQNQVVSLVMDFNLELQEILHADIGQSQFNKKLICFHISQGLWYLHENHVMHRVDYLFYVGFKTSKCVCGSERPCEDWRFQLVERIRNPKAKVDTICLHNLLSSP